MKSRNALTTSAFCCAIGAATCAFGQTAGDTARDTGNKIGDAIRGNPSTQPDKVNAPDAEDIRGALAKTTEQAIDKNGFDNLTSRFVDADRDRIKQAKLTDADWDKLNGRIDQLRKDWKAKYNQDFDIKNEKLVYDPQMIMICRVRSGTVIATARAAPSPPAPACPVTTPTPTAATPATATPSLARLARRAARPSPATRACPMNAPAPKRTRPVAATPTATPAVTSRR